MTIHPDITFTCIKYPQNGICPSFSRLSNSLPSKDEIWSEIEEYNASGGFPKFNLNLDVLVHVCKAPRGLPKHYQINVYQDLIDCVRNIVTTYKKV